MIILKIWDAEYPWDVRAEKVSAALTERGHEVHMVARNRDHRVLDEVLPEARVHRMSPLPWLPPFLDAALMFPFFFNPRWIRLVRRVAKDRSADVILCRDLPLAPSAIFVGRSLGIPVILDMAENYPAMIRSIWEHGRQRPLDWLVRNPSAVTWVENWVLSAIDHVIVVVEESGERLESLGVPPDRITVVRNTPRSERAPPQPRSLSSKEGLELVYLGLLEAPRGLEVVLDAQAICKKRGLPVSLVLIGDGRDREGFVRRTRDLGLSGDDVQFLGFLEYERALERIRAADVGLVPHIANESWNSTIPNKLFDYMSHGLPVISSNARPAARIVRETSCGAVYESRDPLALVDAIVSMLDPVHRFECGLAGFAAVRDIYNWDLDGARLVEAVEAVGGTA